MKKERVTVDELVLLSYLKFDKIDDVDVSVLKNMISDKFELVIDDTDSNYFVMADGTILLEERYVNNIYSELNSDKCKKIKEKEIYNFICNIDSLEFMLRKIKLMGEGAIVSDELSNNFSSLQVNYFCGLYKGGFIIDYCHQDMIYGDYTSVKLTKKGELYLYLIDNNERISFIIATLLGDNCYNKSLIFSFLISKDLSQDIDEILLFDEFIQFCCEYYKENVCIKKTLLCK